MDFGASSNIWDNSSESSKGEPESDGLNSKQKQKMESSDYLSIHVNSSEGSRGEAESNGLNSKQKQTEIAESSTSRRAALKESLKLKLGFSENPSTDVNNLPVLRVPEHIKQLNPDAYRPRLISVGPVHHDQAELRPMEDFKRRYAHNLIGNFRIGIDKLIEVTEDYKEALENNYGITSHQFPRGKFVEMMCIDAAFLLEFLLEKAHPGPFNTKWNNIIPDLFLLENQIPFDYLSNLLALVTPRIELSMLELCDNFLDYIRVFDIGRPGNRSSGGEIHLLDRLRIRMAPTTNGNPPKICKDLCPTISQLHRAGIKFRPSSIHHELTFQQGTLKIPRLTIDHNTGRYFANLVASELFARDFYASDYIAIMDYLIDGPEDVRILVDKGILENYLEEDKAAASLINEIGKSIDMSRDFHYKSLVEGLKAHCERFRNSRWLRSFIKWKRELKTTYFGTPWKTFSVIAAVILLALTFTQTVCSILQL